MFKVVRPSKSRVRPWTATKTLILRVAAAPEAPGHCTGVGGRVSLYRGWSPVNTSLPIILQRLPYNRYVTYITASADSKSDTGAGK